MSDLEQQAALVDLALLAEVSQLLTVIDLDQVLERVLDLMARAVGATKASLFLHHERSDNWQRLFGNHKQHDTQEAVRVMQSVMDKGLAGWVVRNKQGTIVYDTETDSRWHVFDDSTRRVRSALCIPLLEDDKVMAVITLEHVEPHHFNEQHLRLLTIITNQAAVAVRNAQLFNRMQEQQRQLEATLHAIPDVLLVIADDGTILLVNDEAVGLLGGLDRQDIVGHSLAEFLHIDSALAPLRDLHTNPTRDSETWTFEARSDRKRVDYVVTVSPWENPFGGTAGHVIIMHDVTDLRDLDRFKGEMLKMASHDLRSPLALIVGYCDLIRLDTPDDSPIVNYLDVISRSTRRMNILLDDLLRVEEIRTSPAELQQPTDFADLVNKVVENLRLLANAKNQRVVVDVRLKGLTPLVVDPMLIREAMENLVANAVKYTPEGGQIRIHSTYDDWRVHFIVEDNGVGVRAEDIPHIFEWGFRSKRHADQPVEGKGMGLSLVKTVLERHRGEVWVESEEGVGSRFGFWLPR